MEVTSAGLRGRASATAVGRFENSGSNTGNHRDPAQASNVTLEGFDHSMKAETDFRI